MRCDRRRLSFCIRISYSSSNDAALFVTTAETNECDWVHFRTFNHCEESPSQFPGNIKFNYLIFCCFCIHSICKCTTIYVSIADASGYRSNAINSSVDIYSYCFIIHNLIKQLISSTSLPIVPGKVTTRMPQNFVAQFHKRAWLIQFELVTFARVKIAS